MDSNRPTSSDFDTGTWRQRSRSAVTAGTFLSLALLLLLSCASPVSTQGTTPQRTPTTPGNHLSPTPQLTQQYEFTDQDSGRTVTYTVTSRFGIILNQQKYPKQNMQVSCHPPGTLGNVNLPSVAPPLYAVRYEGAQPGICTIKDGTFLLTVRIIALNN